MGLKTKPHKKEKGYLARIFKSGKASKASGSTLDANPPATDSHPIQLPGAAKLPSSTQSPASTSVAPPEPPPASVSALEQNKTAPSSPTLLKTESPSSPKEQIRRDSFLRPEKVSFVSISELWDEAYDDLAKDQSTAELIFEYQNVLSNEPGVDQVSRNKDKRREQMTKITKAKKEEIEDGRWKLKFEDREFTVKDLVGSVVSVIEWGKDYVGSAVQVSPPASLAWAGLLLNPSHQNASRVDGLDKIASIVRECCIREEVYQGRYESATQKEAQNTSTSSHTPYRDTIKELYGKIITFQATYVCFLSGNTVKQWVQDTTKWQDWNNMVDDMSKKNDNLKSLDKLWQNRSLQEEWTVRRQQHKESLEQLNALGDEMRRFYDLISTAQKDQVRAELLTWLHTVKPSTFYDTAIGKRGVSPTGSWLLVDYKFKHWERESNSFLWLHGKAGAGKSVLSSTVIEHLENSHEGDPFTAVAYFYISFKDEATCSQTNLTKSLITQLFGRRPDKPESLLNLSTYRDRGLDPPQAKLEEALRSASGGFTSTYFIIDGLDECPGAEDAEDTDEQDTTRDRRRELLELLERIQGWRMDNLHLLMTSRSLYDIKLSMEKLLKFPGAGVLDLGTAQHSANVGDDISHFIDKELEGGKFAKLPDDLKSKVKKALIEKADGVFHYVSLQLSSIQPPITVTSINAVLAGLPKGLYGTYDRAFLRLRDDQRQQAICVLTWVAFSPVPLTIEELAVAALIDLTTDTAAASDVDHQLEVSEADYSVPPFSKDDQFTDPNDVLHLLPGLLDVQTKGVTLVRDRNRNLDHRARARRVVVLTHFTLLEYLTSKEIKKRPSSGFALNRLVALIQLAEACLRYHVYYSESGSAHDRPSLLVALPLCKYAARQGLQQAENIGRARWPNSLRQLVQFVLTADTKSYNNLKKLSGYPSKRTGEPPIHYVVEKRFSEVLNFLLDHKLADANAPGDSLVGTVMNHACTIQFIDGMKILLKAGADVCLGNEKFPCSLDVAIRFERVKAFHFLLDIPDILSRCHKIGYWPLMVALKEIKDPENDNTVIEDLLRCGADPNAFESGRLPAIHAAVAWRRPTSLKKLLTHGADVHIRDEYFGNALQCAVALGFEFEIRMLLSNGAKLDAPGAEWDSVLNTVREGQLFEGMGGPLAVERLELAQTIFGASSRSKSTSGSDVTLFIDSIEGLFDSPHGYVSLRTDIILGQKIITGIPKCRETKIHGKRDEEGLGF